MSSYKSKKVMSWHQVAVHVLVQKQEALRRATSNGNLESEFEGLKSAGCQVMSQ